MTVRQDALKPYARKLGWLVRIERPWCGNTYGVAPCTASGAAGSECYHTFPTCQDRANFSRTERTLQFCSRGGLPLGETMHPTIVSIDTQPTETKPGEGLATRGKATIKFTDHPVADHEEDPYYLTRAQPAGGTFWGRFIARNPNLAGSTVRIFRGPIVDPFDITAFESEAYVVSRVAGPDASGTVSLEVLDRTKLLDTAMWPVPSAGKIATEDFPAYSHIGAVRGASLSAVTLSAEAEPIDDTYVGHEIYISQGDGAGQRRVITHYVGESRTALVGVDWDVIPSDNSIAEVSPLIIRLDDSSGYPASGHVAIGDEVIFYAVNAFNTLALPDSTWRQQFGTERTDHAVGDKVQLCGVMVDTNPATAMRTLLNAGGIADTHIDLAGMNSELSTWAAQVKVTVCVMAPEKVTAHVQQLGREINYDQWWDPVAELVRGRVNAPQPRWGLLTITDDEIIDGRVDKQELDSERITRSTVDYGLRAATSRRDSTTEYLFSDLIIDAEAESANGYGDTKPAILRSRFLGGENDFYVPSVNYARLMHSRNVPIKAQFSVDIRTEISVGQLIVLKVRQLPGTDGSPADRTFRVVSVDKRDESLAIIARSSVFSLSFEEPRWFWFAPDDAPDYDVATEEQRAKYGYFCDDDGLMSDGTGGYHFTI